MKREEVHDDISGGLEKNLKEREEFGILNFPRCIFPCYSLDYYFF
jgi:hypothetical protein